VPHHDWTTTFAIVAHSAVALAAIGANWSLSAAMPIARH
jgi:hypothetical protein